jgi:phospholipid/cholesterol/gamma-HCH transport system substrate-binding protein
LQIKTETIVGLFILLALGIFFYMTFFLGVFRVDRLHYNSYELYFSDVSGLEKKADVKIAGVKVGWVDKIELVDNEYNAKAHIMVSKRYILRSDAYAIVRQEGVLGQKYLEIIPGDPLLPAIKAGEALSKPGRSPVAVDEILHKVKEIASNVQDVTHSLQASFGGLEGQERMREMFGNMQEAVARIAAFSAVLDRTLSRNEDSINSMMGDFREFARDIRENFPSIRQWIERVSEHLDRDIGRVANKLDSTTSALEDAALHVRNSFKNINSVAEKIDEGKGVIGKLINEDETYHDLKVTVQGLKKYFNKVDTLSIVFDAHGELMYRPAENLWFPDTKGYFDIRLHPNEDHFYLFQLVGSQKGTLKRWINYKKWFDENGNQLLTSELLAQRVAIPELIGTIESTERVLDQFKFGFQFGKIYKDLAFRFGLFENTVGMGVDFDIPFGTDKFRWVTSLEMFDFRGRDRVDDDRPHLKWLNRVFLLRSFYLAFGADDFVSRRNANGFFGAGIRFCDDDIKYLFAQIGLGNFS